MQENKLEYKKYLDEIQNSIHRELLKLNGYKKSGRTFNKQAEDGLVQVINFQSGQYPIGNYIIPGFRESFYGLFTVNLGIYIPEIVELEERLKPSKNVIQEYDCHIRTRLSNLISNEDYWWKISEDSKGLCSIIIEQLQKHAFVFFDELSSREKIMNNLALYIKKYHVMSRNYLDIGLIHYKLGSMAQAEEYFNRHYSETDVHSHKKYVIDLSEKLGIMIHNK